MNWSFIKTMKEPKLKQLLNYLNDNLTRSRRFKWLPEMRPVWLAGKALANARLTELKKQNDAAVSLN